MPEEVRVVQDCACCDEPTCTPPVCSDCAEAEATARAERLAGIRSRAADYAGYGWAADAEWLIGEADRLKEDLATETYRADCSAEANGALRAERDGLAGAVQRMREWADKMEAEAPKPAPGGFFADEVRRVLDGPAQ